LIWYLLSKEKLYSDELGSYISFGIKVHDLSNHETKYISDVSVDKALVKKICRRCTLHQLHPIHLYDVIEDNI